MSKIIVGLFVLLFVCGCNRPCQEVASTQCYENAIYVCNSNYQWEFIQKCNNASSCKRDGAVTYCAKDLEYTPKGVGDKK